MATYRFTDEQIEVINILYKKLALKGEVLIDAYHAIFFVTSTFNKNHAEMIDSAGLFYDLTASSGYMILDIMRQ